jgi:hypothetical protein
VALGVVRALVRPSLSLLGIGRWWGRGYRGRRGWMWWGHCCWLGIGRRAPGPSGPARVVSNVEFTEVSRK